MKTTINIISYGAYVPMYRIKREEYVKTWGSFQTGISEKAVIGYDEDTVTMAVEAGNNALKNAGIKPAEISSVSVASISPPYALRSMAAEVAMALGLSLNISLIDFKESEKAGTTALITAIDLTTNRGGYGLVIAADAPLARPNDELEHGLGTGAVALVIGKGPGIAIIEGFTTASIPFIADRFQKTGKARLEALSIPGYHSHAYRTSVTQAVKSLYEELEFTSADFQHAFIQSRNIKEPKRFKQIIEPDKVAIQSFDQIGDIASAASLMGIAYILENLAKLQERILCVSYGAGTGSDALSIQVTKKQENHPEVPGINEYLARKEYISYNKYLKFKEFIELE